MLETLQSYVHFVQIEHPRKPANALKPALTSPAATTSLQDDRREGRS